MVLEVIIEELLPRQPWLAIHEGQKLHAVRVRRHLMSLGRVERVGLMWTHNVSKCAGDVQYLKSKKDPLQTTSD